MSKGADFRVLFAGLMCVPLIAGADKNGAVLKLGFSTGSTMQSEYKIKPDYATGTLFAAERQDVPSF